MSGESKQGYRITANGCSFNFWVRRTSGLPKPRKDGGFELRFYKPVGRDHFNIAVKSSGIETEDFTDPEGIYPPSQDGAMQFMEDWQAGRISGLQKKGQCDGRK